ncbi:hypothetical protein PINS_up007643 [Pythium insidiosum]|nr:hypothetical protein PINS_up007643 [Pythium insidiosum]
MTPEKPRSRPHTTHTFVELPPVGFLAVWLGFLTVHGLCAAFFIISGIFYNKTPGSALQLGLEAYSIGMPMSRYPLLCRVHAVFAAIHLLLGALMVLWSLWKRELNFGPLQDIASRATVKNELSLDAIQPSGSTISTAKSSNNRSPLKKRVIALLVSVFGRRGFFGVEGEHFEQLLAVREVVESSLQTYQAFRMSQFLARPWLNRFYVGMLVLNCWLVPLVHKLGSRRPLVSRAASLVCDAVLDLMAGMVVPAILMLSYFQDYDTATWGFPYSMWYGDAWFVKFVTEYQIMVIVSWTDLFSRIVFSLGLLSCLESAKELISLRRPAKTGMTHNNNSTHQQWRWREPRGAR